MNIARAIVRGIAICLLTTSCNAINAMDKQSTNQSHDLSTYSRVQDDSERAQGLEVGYFAGGCFWGTEAEFKQVPGVVATTVGYTGGITKNPTYEKVCAHDTKHAETVRVVFDPKKISYERLVGEFLKLHDPTTLNRQGPDIGDQYRSAIFFANNNQKKEAQAAIDAELKTKGSNYRIVTSLEQFDTFYTAEDYHQDYFQKNGGGACHVRH